MTMHALDQKRSVCPARYLSLSLIPSIILPCFLSSCRRAGGGNGCRVSWRWRRKRAWEMRCRLVIAECRNALPRNSCATLYLFIYFFLMVNDAPTHCHSTCARDSLISYYFIINISLWFPFSCLLHRHTVHSPAFYHTPPATTFSFHTNPGN